MGNAWMNCLQYILKDAFDTPSHVLRFLNLFATRWILLSDPFGGVMNLERKSFI